METGVEVLRIIVAIAALALAFLILSPWHSRRRGAREWKLMPAWKGAFLLVAVWTSWLISDRLGQYWSLGAEAHDLLFGGLLVVITLAVGLPGFSHIERYILRHGENEGRRTPDKA